MFLYKVEDCVLKMAHAIVPAAEEILDKEFPVHNHGFVRLVDYLGGDERIVQAARVSYGAGTKTVRQDRGLIRYLMRNEHTSPFEQVLMTFHAKMPIFVARQWVRHRTARLNEISGRYSILKDEFYLPSPDDVHPQSEDNKQGRSDEKYSDKELGEILLGMELDQQDAYEEYQKLIDRGLARELARINLPVSTYTEWYWNIDLHNLFHFLGLRMDLHAQKEIRDYANILAGMAQKVAPYAYEAFEDYKKNAITFSVQDLEMLSGILKPEFKSDDLKNYERTKFLKTGEGVAKLTGEGKELQKKLQAIEGYKKKSE